ncbi:hypothetical protein [Aquipuribacter sp. SD81]|uniref:hypothetical protein n=1 Tax=Aquipuribacter sp. SD81 TaxID=3127703 RepID=UPI003018951F
MAGTATRYEFLVPGELSESVLQAFPSLQATRGPAGGTVLYGPVRDESELSGLLQRFASLAVRVVEVRQLPD